MSTVDRADLREGHLVQVAGQQTLYKVSTVYPTGGITVHVVLEKGKTPGRTTVRWLSDERLVEPSHQLLHKYDVAYGFVAGVRVRA